MTNDSNESKQKLFDIALQTRNFEISLFWQRSNYFLVLNTAIAVGFFSQTSGLYRLILAILGTLSSILWVRVNAGSKFWQSRWERRLQLIEEDAYPGAQLFSAAPPTISEDVEASLQDGGNHAWRQPFNALVLTKPSVSFAMTLLSCGFLGLWCILGIAEFVGLAASLDASHSPMILSGPVLTMNFEMFVPVILALQFAAFGWRINREISVGDEGRRTWLTLPDYLNVTAMLAVVALCVVWPLHTGAAGPMSRSCIAAATVLLVFHPISMAAHYRLFSLSGRTKYDQQGRDIPWITGQEMITVMISIPFTVVAFWLVYTTA